MKSYFEHLSNKNISLKITIEKILRILFKNLQNKKKTKEIFPLSFYFLQRKTHPLESMAKCLLREKISFSCCSRFLVISALKIRLVICSSAFSGSSRYFQSNWQSLDSQGSYSGLKYAQFAQNHAVFCDLWLCEGFYSVWSILGCLNRFYGNFGLFGLLLLKLEWKPCDCPPFFVLFVARCNIGMLINLL